jgi:hypothetical protein
MTIVCGMESIMLIKREDMLELTRRMTVKRNCFTRIAGCYVDEEGYIDDTFNTRFCSMSNSDIDHNIKIAKDIPFAATNEQLKGYLFDGKSEIQMQMRQLLAALNRCHLENDAMLESLYEHMTQQLKMNSAYAILFFSGTYDIPVKGTDGFDIGDSVEVYDFLICAVCPLVDEYDPGKAEAGFLFPAFTDRSSDDRHILIFNRNVVNHEWMTLLGL